MITVRTNDRFTDMFPVVLDEDIQVTMRREGYNRTSFAGIYVGTGGTVACLMNNGKDDVRTVTVADGANINGEVRQINTSGTSADDMMIFVL